MPRASLPGRASDQLYDSTIGSSVYFPKELLLGSYAVMQNSAEG